MKGSGRSSKRVVVKIGSSLFYSKENKLDFVLINSIADQILELTRENVEVVVVTSGAIGLGMSSLNLSARPKELSSLQAVAAIGQNELMGLYRMMFKERGLKCGQVLLTWEDFDEHSRYLNAKNTLLSILKFKSIPVINENDTVATDEIKFGDNDRLSAMVASLIGADLLIILSDVDGLLLRNKKTVVRVVEEITSQVKALAAPTTRKTSVGGMITKIQAAKIAVDSGVPCVIAGGRHLGIVTGLVHDPASSGTLFLPKKSHLAEKERWIAFGTKAKGKVIVDEGAKAALLKRKSLLSVGVKGIEGNFNCGDVVSLTDSQGNEFARGKVCLSCKHLGKVKGTHSDKEVMHCDNIVIL